MPALSPAAIEAVRQLRAQTTDRVEGSQRAGPMVLATIVGLVAGLGAVGFAALIDGLDWFFFDVIYDDVLGALHEGSWRLILIPALGAVLVGPITRIFAPEARGHGVPEVMLAVETQGGRIRPRVAIAKSLASALTIGSGGSVGKEGPIVQIGSAFGSTLGQFLRLSEGNVRLLVAAGAAGGIAGTFNAPIAGVFFALEVILRRFSTRNFSVVVLSAVVATAVAAAFRGDEPAIPIPEYELQSAAEIPLYGVLGVACALVAVVFIHGLYWSEDRFEGLPFPPQLVMPVVGGAMVGVLAMLDSGVLGLGEDTLETVLLGDEAARTMALLLVLKLAATSITIGSGGSGGVFRPSLFLGGMVGGTFGAVVHGLLGGSTGMPGAYATVGMAAMFAGTARAPITSVLILFEMTRDYGIMLPLMTAVTTSTVVSQLLSPGTVYTIKLQRRGVHIEEEAEPQNVMQQLRVSDAMAPVMEAFGPQTSVEDLALAFEGDPDPVGLVVSEDGEMRGLVTGFDVSEALAEGRDQETAADICSTDVRTIFPDQSLHQALGIFARRGIRVLPVVDRANRRMPIGLLRRTDITQAYAESLERGDARRRRRRLARATRSDDVRYLDLRVTRDSGLAGRELSELHLTEDAVIVAVRHDGATLIPRGHTRLDEGDRVTVIVAASAADEVRAIFEGART